MPALWNLVLANTIFATLMAVAIACVFRNGRRPVVEHVLWILVLAKLVIPPALSLPVPGFPGAVSGHLEDPQVAIDADPAKPRRTEAFLDTNHSVASETANRGHGDESSVVDQSRLLTSVDMPAVAPPLHAAQVANVANPNTGFFGQTNWLSFRMTELLVGLWLVGSGVWAALTISRIVRYQLLIRGAAPAPSEIVETASQLAAQLGLRQLPQIVTLPGTFAPAVWPIGRLRIMLPRDLLQTLPAAERRSLLAHELIHVRRRDHWVRFLELAVTAVYWWLPTVWWARSRLRRAEEACCDAWLVQEWPSATSAYAQAIVATAEFLSSASHARPTVLPASGMHQFRSLKQRLLFIYDGKTPHRLTRSLRIALFLSAIACWAWLPTRAQSRSPATANNSSPAANFSIERLPESCEVLYKSLSPDGKKVAFVGSRQERGKKASPGLFLVDLADGSVRTLIDKALKTAPAWSPDSTKLAIGSAEGYVTHYPLVIIDVRTGAVDETGAEGVGADWSPDGREIAVTTQIAVAHTWSRGVPVSGRIGVWDVVDRTMRLLGPEGRTLRIGANSTAVSGSLRPVWSPDGKWIAFEQYAATSEAGHGAVVRPVCIIRRDGSDLRQALDEFRPFRWAADSRALLFKDETSQAGLVEQNGEKGGFTENPSEERMEIAAFKSVPREEWTASAPPAPTAQKAPSAEPAQKSSAPAASASKRSIADNGISGVVVDPAGRPVAGAMLLLKDRYPFYADYNRGLIPQTDSSGTFHFTGVRRGEHRLTVFSLDWGLKTVKVSVPQTAPLTIAVQKGKRVEFRTVNAKREPIAGIHFHPQAPSGKPSAVYREVGYLYVLDFLSHRDLLNTESDEHGVFVWENAPVEPLGYQIYSAKVLAPAPRDYGPAGSPHTLVFRERIPLHAKVVDAATGRPIATYTIYEGTHFKSNSPGLWEWNLPRPSKARPGEFDDTLKSIARLVQYRIQAEGYRPRLSDIFDAEKLPDAPVSIEFRLEKDSGYNGLVLTPDGKPAAGAKVYTKIKGQGVFENLALVDGVADESKMTAVTTADAAGRIRLATVSEPYVCFISHDSGYAQMMDVDLFHQPDVKLNRWGKIEGELRVDGKPAANIPVRLNQMNLLENSAMPDVTHRKAVQTDSAGRYAFDRCVAGQWNESIVYDDQVAQMQNRIVDVVPGQRVEQRIGAEGTNLIGRILLPNGADGKRSFVYLIQPEEAPSTTAGGLHREQAAHLWRSRQFVRPKTDGSFRFFNVEPTEQELTVTVFMIGDNPSWARYSKQITVTRDMFRGKTPEDSIDLGEIELKSAAR